MIKFNILSFLDQTGKYGDAQTLKNIQFYLEALANQYNGTMASKDVTVQVKLTLTPETTYSASATSTTAWDSLSQSFKSTTETLIQKGVDLATGGANFILNLSDGVINTMNSQLSKSYVATATGGLSLLIHELGHALDINTALDTNTGLPRSSYITTYDKFVTIQGNQPYFTDVYASAIYGSKVPLKRLGDSDSIAHLSKAFLNGTITDKIGSDPMSESAGYIPQDGYLYTDLDLAIFKSCGYQNLNTLTSYDGHTFITGLNTKSIVGTSQVDKVIQDGVRNDYVLTKVGNLVIETIKYDGSTISFSGIERFQFADKLIALDFDGNAGQAYRLYQAAFNRTPDVEGLGYWIGQMDKGAENLNHVAAGFVGSAEFKTLYGQNVSDNAFLTALYSNVLHRAPDQAGFDYWNGRVNAGMTRPDILASFSESVENQAQVIGSIQNGITYVPYVM